MSTTVNELFESINMELLEKVFLFELFKIKNRHDREDTKQSALLNIWRSLSNYTKEDLPPEKITSFAQTIVRRTVADYFRSQSKATNGFTNTSTDVSVNTDDDSSYSFVLGVEDRQAEVSIGISDLRADYTANRDKFSAGEQKVIEKLLFSNEGMGMSMTEITKELGFNKSLATHATTKLRSLCRP